MESEYENDYDVDYEHESAKFVSARIRELEMKTCSHFSCVIAATVIFFASLASSVSNERFYEKKTSWHETLRAARETLHRHEEQVGSTLVLPDLGASDFTLTAWIRTTAGGTIIAKTAAEGPWKSQYKAWFVRDGKLCFDIGWVGCITSAHPVNDGQWHHVAFSVGAVGFRQTPVALDLLAGF